MTRVLAFRILNVFAVDGDDVTARLSGNPLCVFEDGSAVDDVTMQALARQFNLSETTFLVPAGSEVTRGVRIFTPSYEMPFAGHPSLGSAYVARDLCAARAQNGVTLDMKAGVVHVTHEGDRFTLRAPCDAPHTRVPEAPRATLARMVGLEESALAGDAMWLDTGVEQLMIPVRSIDDVRRAKPNAALLAEHGFSRNESMAYVWARAVDRPGEIEARFFFIANGAVIEDPATGSACANLGGYLVAVAHEGATFSYRVLQGAAIGRPSVLALSYVHERGIFVGGRVVELGRGTLSV